MQDFFLMFSVYISRTPIKAKQLRLTAEPSCLGKVVCMGVYEKAISSLGDA